MTMTNIYATIGAVVFHAAWIIPAIIIFVLLANGILNTSSQLAFKGVKLYRYPETRAAGFNWCMFAWWAVLYFFSTDFVRNCFLTGDGTFEIYSDYGSWKAWNRWEVYPRNDSTRGGQ